ncbi:MAG: ATP-binding protein [Bacteroidota bacterium]
MQDEIALYQRTLKRERLARKAAEQLLEAKAAELFEVNQQLQELNQNLEKTVLKRTNELSQANARLQTLVSNLNAGLLAEDQHRNIILVNQRFCEIFNIVEPPHVLLGVDCSDFAHQGKEMFKAPDSFIERIDQLLDKKTLVIADQLETADGRFLERDFIPIIEGGHYLGHLWQYRDITDRVGAENELLQARKSAEAAAVAREQFIANMSHEIRTPMNSILGLSDILLKSEVSDKQRNYLSIINDSATNLLVVINDILDFSKVDAGKMQFESIGFKTSDLSRNLIATVQAGAEAKDLEIISKIDPEIPDILIGDPYRISQVMLNLLSNAIKFTDKGFVKLQINLLEKGESAAKVRFLVKDSGVGIPAEKAATIFEDFAQVDASVTRKYGGTGLGLTISSKLVRMMGGEIKVDSEPGKGATFAFELELPLGAQKDLPGEDLPPPDLALLKGRRILLVEDHPFNQELALAVMADWEVDITVADNGQIALDFMEKESFDVVLMDVQMPVMDGIEATRQIKMRYGAKPPIIALTANALRSQEARLREGQMDGYVSKPFKAEVLQQEILRVLQLENMPIPTPQPVAKTTEQTEGPLYDRAVLEGQTGGNPAMTKRMLTIFLEMTPPIIADFRAARKARDLRQLENLAHKLKPSVRLMGMHAILDDTLALEKATANGLHPDAAIALADKLVAHLTATLALVKAEEGL